jgi:DNA invertase Pin-like site-specific DNA recombinase
MPKDRNRVLILKRNLTEEEAFRHEIYMIAVFGRKDIGTGILGNKSDGGEGPSGAKRPDLVSYNQQHKKGKPPINRKRVEITFANGRIGVYACATLAAKALGVSVGTITHWTQQKVTPSVPISARYV